MTKEAAVTAVDGSFAGDVAALLVAGYCCTVVVVLVRIIYVTLFAQRVNERLRR